MCILNEESSKKIQSLCKIEFLISQYETRYVVLLRNIYHQSDNQKYLECFNQLVSTAVSHQFQLHCSVKKWLNTFCEPLSVTKKKGWALKFCWRDEYQELIK